MPTFRRVLSDFYVWFLDLFPQAAPLIPTEEVKLLLANIGLSQSELAKFFKIFTHFRHRDGNKWVDGKMVISTNTVVKIINDKREYLNTILKHILQLGGCYDSLDWSHFLFVFVRFCSLSKVELCQLLFLIIVRDLRGLDIHYLTSTQLDRFYDTFRNSQVPENMDCNKIRFSNFPLSRYYVTDFVEICFLYSPLIYPMQSLQRKFQSILPSLRFWDEYASLAGTTRKITLDYFLIRKTNVQLSGITTFQETCDLLLLSSHLIHERLRQRKTEITNAQFLMNENSKGCRGSQSSTHSQEKRDARLLETEFIARSRESNDDSKYKIDNIYRKMDPNALLIRKSTSLQTL